MSACRFCADEIAPGNNPAHKCAACYLREPATPEHPEGGHRLRMVSHDEARCLDCGAVWVVPEWRPTMRRGVWTAAPCGSCPIVIGNGTGLKCGE